MKKHLYEEFVRVDSSFTQDKLDFYGDLSPLTADEQKLFLEKYAKYNKNRFGQNASYVKAVSKKEVEDCKNNFSFNLQNGLEWAAYKRKKASVYSGWQLYTERAIVKDNVLTLKDDYSWPVPCAKYEFLDEQLLELNFSVKISNTYKVPVCGGLMSTTTGRFVELRAGIKEIIKLYFSPNGFFIYKDSSTDIYRYKSNILGKYAFDEWNDIKLKLFGDKFTIEFNGEVSEFERNLTGIDTIFVGGGMQPADFWQVKFEHFKSDKKTADNLFVECNQNLQEEIYLGKAQLPYVLGTQDNKDCELVLKTKINCKKNKTYRLDIEALDPGGEVLINGKTLVKKDDFNPFSLDITDCVKEGENNLHLVIYPRAPESLFNWHKYNDYYSGWYCQCVNLVESDAFSQANLEVETVKTGDKTSFNVIVKNAEFKNLAHKDITYKIYIQKSYPTMGEKALLVEGELKEKEINQNFIEKVELWNTQNPVLYQINVEFFDGDNLVYSTSTETGFRTISQKDGKLYLNGKRLILKGALTMQFLPPYKDLPLNHVLPTEEQIIEQVLMIKSLNGNCLRMHQLGYGTNDKRFAMVCDRLGVMLIWTTRLIDSAENMQWSDDWKQAEDYKKQILAVKNHPSIIIWEGSNEGHFYPTLIDKVYDNFVTAVKSVDKTRLLCPISHLYYGWGDPGEKCGYYNNDGTKDDTDQAVKASFGWGDELVIRSAHPYGILLGYGQPWQHMATQCYKFQGDLLDGSEKAYIVSEFAVIGRQNPNTPEAKQFINKKSYEFNDEMTALGYIFADEEWEISQAYQAMCVAVATKQLRKLDVDGMLWCCLTGGANNTSYLKPIIDFYGYTKLSFYQLREAFNKITAFNQNPDVLYSSKYTLRPLIVGLTEGNEYELNVQIYNEQGKLVIEKSYQNFIAKADKEQQADLAIELDNGYYVIRYTVIEK